MKQLASSNTKFRSNEGRALAMLAKGLRINLWHFQLKKGQAMANDKEFL